MKRHVRIRDRVAGLAALVCVALAETLARSEGAAAAVRSRAVSFNPTIGVSGGYSRTNHVDEFGLPLPSGGQRVIYPDIPDNFFSRVALNWPIYTAGRREALVRAAEAEARAATADVEVTRADLRLEVVRTYWALVTSTESIRVVEEALARADAHLRDVRSRFDSGLIPPNDVSAAEAQRARQQLQVIEARQLHGVMLDELRRLTGITGEIVLSEALRGGTETPPGVPQRAEQHAISERIAAAEQRVEALAAQRKPIVAFNAAADYANPNPRIFPRADLWRTSGELGFTVNWTLWDGGRVAAERAEAEAATRTLRARYNEVASLIASEVRQRQLDLDATRAATETAEAAVHSAAETRRVVAERFNVGVATSTEVLDAQVALLQAELDRTRALANVRLAQARLDRAMGRR